MLSLHEGSPAIPLSATFTVYVSPDEASAGARRSVRFFGPDGQERALQVDVPPGVAHDAVLTLDATGEHGDCMLGHMAIRVVVLPSLRYEYRGDDIHLTLQADRARARRESAVVVHVPGGAAIRVPVDADSDYQVHHFAGLGMPRAYDRRRRGTLSVYLYLVDTGNDAPPAGPQPRRWWRR